MTTTNVLIGQTDKNAGSTEAYDSKLVAYYRADRGVTKTNGLVSQWDDQSGNGNHLVQATSSAQPAHFDGGYGNLWKWSQQLAALDWSARNGYGETAQLLLDGNSTLSPGTGPVSFTRATAASYIDSTTGLIAYVASGAIRYQNDSGSVLQSFIEEATTNELLYSEDLTNAAYTATGAAAVISGTAPDGNATANLVTEDISTGVHSVGQATTTTGTVTYSAFLKQYDTPYIFVGMYDGTSGSAEVRVNLATQVLDTTNVDAVGSWTGISYTITAYANSWYRVTVTGTTGAGAGVTPQILLGNDAGQRSYTGNGASGVYAWGNQLEALAKATSYFSTTTVAGTRNADLLSLPNANIPTLANGCTIVIGASPINDGIQRYLFYAGGTYQTAIYQSSSGHIVGILGGITINTTTIPTVSSHTYALRTDGTTHDLFQDGVVIGTAIGALNQTTGDLFIGSTSIGSQINSTVGGLLLYSRALSQTEIAGYNSTVTENAGTDPLGGSTANAQTPTASAIFDAVAQSYSFVSGQEYTQAFYAKANGYNYVAFEESTSPYLRYQKNSSGTLRALIEQTGINEFTYSSDLSNAAWLSLTSGSGITTIADLPLNGTDALSTGTGPTTFARTGNSTYLDHTTNLITSAAADTLRYENDSASNLGGLIEGPSRNNINSTEDFTVSWLVLSGSPSSVAAAATDPSGNSSATSFTAASTDAIYQNHSNTYASTYCFSLYVKSSGSTDISWEMGSTGNTVTGVFTFATQNIATSSAGNGTVVQSGYETLANGWYRIFLSGHSLGSGATSDAIIKGSSTGTETSYIWGAQLELGAEPTSYIPMTYGVVNLLPYTDAMTNAPWSTYYNNGTGNAELAPDGTTSAYNVVEPSYTISGGGQTDNIAVSAQAYVFSCYFKASGRSWGRIYYQNTSTASVWFDLANGAVGSSSGSLAPTGSIEYAGDGWYRCAMFVTFTGGINSYIYFVSSNADGSSSYSGSGASAIYLWGSQMETGSTLTGYQSKVGSNYDAMVRTGDYTSIPNANIPTLNQNADIYVTASIPNDGSLHYVFSSQTGGNTSLWRDTAGTIQASYGGIALSSSIAVTDENAHAYHISYDGTNATLLIDSNSAATAVGTPTQPTDPIYIGSYATTGYLNSIMEGFSITTGVPLVGANPTLTGNAVVAPDGSSAATSFISGTNSGVNAVYQTLTLVSGTTYTASIYAKASGYNYLMFRETSSGGPLYSYFDLATGIAGTVDATHAVNSVLIDGYYRVSFTFTSTSTSGDIGFGLTNADATPSIIGNGTSGIDAWGMQFEANEAMTSYIPTTSAAATRNADSLSIPNANVPTVANGFTIICSASVPNDGTVKMIWRASDGTSIWQFYRAATTGVLAIRIGPTLYTTSYTPDELEHSYEVVYDGSNLILYVDGTSQYTTAGPSVADTAGDLYLGSDSTATYYLNGTVGGLYIYARGLTGTEVANFATTQPSDYTTKWLLEGDESFIGTGPTSFTRASGVASYVDGTTDQVTYAAPYAKRRTWIDLTTGTAATTSGSHIPTVQADSNGYWRIEITHTPTVSTNAAAAFGFTNADNVAEFVGNGTSGGYLWGMQMVTGSPTAPAYTETFAAGSTVMNPSAGLNPFMTFDGLAQFLATSAFTLNQPESVYIVMEMIDWTATDVVYDGATANSMQLLESGTTPDLYVQTSTGTIADSNGSVGNLFVVGSVYNGASSSTKINKTTTITGNVGTDNAGGFTLGAAGAGANFGHILVHEVLIYGAAHGTQTQDDVIAALMNKYGVT